MRAVLHIQKRIRHQLRRAHTLAALGTARLANEYAGLNPFYRPEGELRACPACGGSSLKVLDVLPHHRRGAPYDVTFAGGCRACGLVFANPLPSAEELAAYYAEGAGFAEDLERRGLAGGAPRAGRPARISEDEGRKLRLLFEPASDYVDVMAPPPGARVLDYGCGPGRLLNRLQALGWVTYGIEPAVKSAFPQHHELHEPPEEPTFLLVTLHHVLEHLRDPLDVLRALSRSMLDDGILYLSVPRLDALPAHRDFHYCLNPDGHILAYTRDCLTTLLDMAGLVAITRPESGVLDELLTNGQPRRLRMFARKKRPAEAGVSTRPPEPLRAAEEALRAFHGEDWSSMVPVRLRASRVQCARRRRLLAHRWEKLVAPNL